MLRLLTHGLACLHAFICHASAGQLFRQLVDLFAFYMAFPIDDHTGDELAEEAVARAHYERIQQLQLLFFRQGLNSRP